MATKIKICGMTDKNIVNELSKLNIDYLGFINIKRSKRFVSLNKINNLTKNLENKNFLTLVIDDENPEEINNKVNKTGIKRVQFHSNITINNIKKLKELNNTIKITMVIGIKNKIDLEVKNNLEEYSQYVDSILFDYIKDGLTGGTNTHIPIETAVEASKIVKNKNPKCNVILAGGLNYNYLKEIFEYLDNFDIIDVNSGVEDSPGIKNVEKIKIIIELIKN
ncbi:MAG: phosphoribosylanthranilate isomerase [Methanobrevibacter sp.]